MENTIIKSFDSVAAFATYLNSNKKQETWQRESSLETGDWREEFTTTKSYEAADDLLRNGDDNNYNKMIEAGLKTDLKAGQKNVLQYRSSVVGAVPSVPAYLSGNPNCMIQARRVSVPAKVVNIVYINRFSALVDAQDIVKTGVSVVDAARSIEANGTRVNLYICCVVELKKKQNAGFLIKIKDSSQKFDLKKLAYLMINPSFLRRHGFRFFEVTKGLVYDPGYGRGVGENDLKKIFGQNKKIQKPVIVDGAKIVKLNNTAVEKYIKSQFNVGPATINRP